MPQRMLLNVIFLTALLEHTRAFNPVLYQQILEAPVERLGDLRRQAIDEQDRREDDQLAQVIATSTRPQTPPQSPTHYSPPPAHREKTHHRHHPARSLLRFPRNINICLKWLKDVLGDDLDDRSILRGIENNVFNKVLYFPVEARKRSIELEKADYLRTVQALQQPSGRRSRSSSSGASSPEAVGVRIPPGKEPPF